jgi:hypothetical protein
MPAAQHIADQVQDQETCAFLHICGQAFITKPGDKGGEFALIAPTVTGKDAANRPVSGSGAAAKGEVTSLIVGIEQKPARLRLGADNNNDGEHRREEAK